MAPDKHQEYGLQLRPRRLHKSENAINLYWFAFFHIFFKKTSMHFKLVIIPSHISFSYWVNYLGSTLLRKPCISSVSTELIRLIQIFISFFTLIKDVFMERFTNIRSKAQNEDVISCLNLAYLLNLSQNLPCFIDSWKSKI